MADIGASNWNETDSSNNSAPPDGAPSGTMLPSQCEPWMRATMGAIKRFWDKINSTATSAGTNTITLAYTVAAAAYRTGEVFRFIAGGTNTGAATLNVSALGAKAIQWQGAALIGGEIVAGRVATVVYDGTVFQLANSQLTATTDAGSLISGTLPVARLNGLNQISTALVADVALNNTGLFFDGPTIAQGVTGSWFIVGQVTLVDTGISADFLVKLWDGSNVVASTKLSSPGANKFATVTLSGFLTSPAGNLRVSVQDVTSTAGAIKFNASGSSRDSYIGAFRIA